jgi:predicted ABC-type transport system involved in lysophospholipase L1 biosynthesis ATPase subunit
LLRSISPISRIDCRTNCRAGRRSGSGSLRALVHCPALLLADEPTGQLDRTTGQATLSVPLDYVRRHAMTFVIATHDPAVAERVETLWRMEHGRLTARQGGGTA